MSSYNAAILDTAGKYLGLEEWPGAKHNPTVLGFFEAVGQSWVKDDETPWCAAFVGAILAELGLVGTGKLNARSYLEWGTSVSMKDARPGDVVVFWRGSKSGWQGHVAILVRFGVDQVLVRGGNQGNKVSDAFYPVSRILSIRRADGGRMVENRPTLRNGSKGAFVLDLQDQLRALRAFPGDRDGIFGQMTDVAVRAFQAENGLTPDGVVGPNTWRALAKATPPAQRNATVDDLRQRGSATIAEADRGEKMVKRASLAGVAGMSIDTVMKAADQLDGVEGTLASLQTIVLENWIILGLIVLAGFLYWQGPKVMDSLRQRRLADHQTGANRGR